jgi:hypothetical protein
MNIQQYLDHMSSLSQHTRVKDKGQLSLGMLIEAIEGCEKDVNVVYDFGYMCPTSIDSWRGSYSELALNYESFKSEDKELTRDRFIVMLKDAVGKTFTGYKGGDFTMTEETPIWVANYGESCNTAVVGVHDAGWQIVILTAYLEY